MRLSDALRDTRGRLLGVLLVIGLTIGGVSTAYAGVPAAVVVSAPDGKVLVLFDLNEVDLDDQDIAAVELAFRALNNPAIRDLLVELAQEQLGAVGDALLPGLLEGVTVAFVPPSFITETLGLPDAEAADDHLVDQGGFQDLGLDMYVRAPVTRVTGPTSAPNIRLDLFVTTEENGAPGEEEYTASIEVPEETVDLGLLLGGVIL